MITATSFFIVFVSFLKNQVRFLFLSLSDDMFVGMFFLFFFSSHVLKEAVTFGTPPFDTCIHVAVCLLLLTPFGLHGL